MSAKEHQDGTNGRTTHAQRDGSWICRCSAPGLGWPARYRHPSVIQDGFDLLTCPGRVSAGSATPAEASGYLLSFGKTFSNSSPISSIASAPVTGVSIAMLGVA